jgi:hypothetical protein
MVVEKKGRFVEDLRSFLDEIGGADQVWAVQFGKGAGWLPVGACALSVPLAEEPNRRVLFYIDAGALGRGHAFRLADFAKTPTGFSGVSLAKDGERGFEVVFRGSNRQEWPPNESRWLAEETEVRQDQHETARRFIIEEYEIAEKDYLYFEKGRQHGND